MKQLLSIVLPLFAAALARKSRREYSRVKVFSPMCLKLAATGYNVFISPCDIAEEAASGANGAAQVSLQKSGETQEEDS